MAPLLSTYVEQASFVAKRHNPMSFVGRVVGGTAMAYAAYKLSSGPSQLRYERYLTLQPESKFTGLLAFNFFHTDLMSLAFNSAVIATLGKYTYNMHGQNKFLQLFGMGAAGSALLCGLSAYNDHSFRAAGMMGPSAALITYHFFNDPRTIRIWHMHPTLAFAAFVFYGFYCHD